jgi:hypothetical protein
VLHLKDLLYLLPHLTSEAVTTTPPASDCPVSENTEHGNGKKSRFRLND